jgi:apolipoprotein N-acyltransferase
VAARLAPAGWTRPALALPAAWALLEWVRGWFLTGFPWLALGYSQAPDSPLAGYAPVLGVYGVGLMAALAAGLLALLPDRRALAGVVLALLTGWGLHQVPWTQPAGAPVKVALLQGNVAQDMKFNPDRLVPTLREYARMVQATDARLIVLPETALPLFRSAVPPDYLGALGVHAAKNGGDVLIGLPEDLGTGQYYNSLISLGASPEGGYRKHHLVPFGEFVPFGFRWLVDLMHIPLGDFSVGDATQPAIAAAGQRLAVNICYEDAFGEERIHAARDATLLVNVSNDAWFGASLAPAQHLQIGALRSLETGRGQLRANNTGVTAILDHQGRVQAQLPPFTRATLTGQVQGREGLTPFLRWGNIPALLLALSLLAASFVLKKRLS